MLIANQQEKPIGCDRTPFSILVSAVATEINDYTYRASSRVADFTINTLTALQG
jgi:hypothetical protein